MKKFRYILRYYIDPGYEEDTRIKELVRYCQDSTIDEVMLFFNPEELFTGHITIEEIKPWVELAKRIKAALAEAGVGLSLNPWTTLVHVSRGRTLHPGQDFTLMVGVSGRDNGVTVCPMCKNWLDYICELWGYVARELTPAAIWVEDDWRLHNHGPALGWGGCFCHLHMEEFSRRVGREVSREELIAAVYGEGEVHPWRKIWLDLNKEVMVPPLRRIREAVKQGSPATRLGLMCAGVDGSSIEGRDWHGFQDALGFEPSFLVRPHINAYTEVWAMRHDVANPRMLCAVLKPPLEISPEMETGPRHGDYSRGAAYGAMELEKCVCFGSHNITINVFDMLGSGTVIEPDLGKELRRVRPRVDAVYKLNLDDHNSLGAEILFSENVARYRKSAIPGSPAGLENQSCEWGHAASILGFSCKFINRITPSKQPRLVNSQTLNAFSEEEIKVLLSGNVILDGSAALSLVERGLGELIGVKSARLHRYNESPCSYEMIHEPDPAVYGVPNPRMTLQRAVRLIYEFERLPGSEELSGVFRGDKQYMFSGSIFFVNSLGGRIAVLAAPIGEHPLDDEWYYMGYFSVFRRIFIQRLLRRIAPEMQGVFAEERPFQTFCTRCENGALLAAFNSTTDFVERLVLRIENCRWQKFELLDENGCWQEGKCESQLNPDGSLQLTVTQEIRPLGSIIIKAVE